MDNVNTEIIRKDDFSSRLRIERAAMNLSQEEFGRLGGVKKNAQHNYESGDRQPSASYLSAIAAAGVDVLYILTGQRRADLPILAASQLPPEVRTRLRDAIEAIEEGLAAVERTASPDVKAELVMAAYDLLGEAGQPATAQIIRLVKAA
ncbi:helix-turn-helix domain-containing protein [Paracoccus jiaweipingae]|uniref:helix-turn-helix domain-containing protein n=1 Tax=Paracoccus sp. p2-l61 TaxID=3366950 RepID=UPI0037923F7E